jgi:hypothetical protein
MAYFADCSVDRLEAGGNGPGPKELRVQGLRWLLRDYLAKMPGEYRIRLSSLAVLRLFRQLHTSACGSGCEHIATAQVKSFLGWLATRPDPPRSAER